MKLYAKTIPQTLPDWATTVTKSGDLFEIQINDKHPNFQSLLEDLETLIVVMKLFISHNIKSLALEN